MMYSCLGLILFCGGLHSLEINGKEYRVTHEVERNVSKRVVYEDSGTTSTWVARSTYNQTYLDIGWDTFDVETNPEVADRQQAHVAGYLEGVETQSAIYDHHYNIIRPMCIDETDVCAQVNKFLETNTQWVKDMIAQHAATDIYWKQVDIFYEQMKGLSIGYKQAAPAEEALSDRDILWMNFFIDIDTVMTAIRNETNRALKGFGHCSALIKLRHGQSDVLVAHNTWIGYDTMKRIIKRYTLPFKQVPGTSMSFTSYPGLLASGDDFYIINTGLIAQETTNDNNDASLWTLIQPEGKVLEIVRATVANRLAEGGRSWAKIFSKYNSGTINNQWMIVDMKKFSPGSVGPELLWVLEQMPGYIRSEDQTDLLTNQGYWASYNRPFYPDIFNMSGHQELVQQYGDFFSYDKTPRALIFKRDQHKVVDLDSMMALMRYNDFEHDPLSRCECDPPYSSENTIASRSDLNPANGTYPFYALSHRASGATDAKVTNHELSKNLSFLAVNGPTTGTNLPPFQWSESDFNDKLSHRGHPDLFNFDPVLISWPSQHN